MQIAGGVSYVRRRGSCSVTRVTPAASGAAVWPPPSHVTPPPGGRASATSRAVVRTRPADNNGQLTTTRFVIKYLSLTMTYLGDDCGCDWVILVVSPPGMLYWP